MPAFLGLPVLIRFIGWIIAALIGYFSKLLTLGVARIALAISLFLGLIIGLNTLLVSYLSSLVAVLPPDISDAISYILPSNALPCFYAVFSPRQQFLFLMLKTELSPTLTGINHNGCLCRNRKTRIRKNTGCRG
ncbi:minor coat protein [Dickeya fangzhongdai]|uniref:minor coat protein n=1 Tax=Dickeya fangzhongdai TaxID=1778540 RepID=UPI0026DF9D86|nr:minor coat protein [Dickeya fangzhongdai]WKV51036.1 minor coat protein [Dickeya fangzhongdai]